jgi:hypothetical protein
MDSVSPPPQETKKKKKKLAGDWLCEYLEDYIILQCDAV